MEALNLLAEKYGPERVLCAVNAVAKDWEWEVRLCCKCGDLLYQGMGYVGDGGWRCKPCGEKERGRP